MRACALLLVVAAVAAAAALSATGAPAAAGACKVPKLTALTTSAAKAAVKRAGCPASAFKATSKCESATAKIGRVLDQKPLPRAALKKGQKIAVHVGVFCKPPPPPPPPPEPPDFVGDFVGTYSGILVGDAGCPDIPISGIAEVIVEQLGTTSYDVRFGLEKAHVVTTENCMEVTRTNSFGELTATATGTAPRSAGPDVVARRRGDHRNVPGADGRDQLQGHSLRLRVGTEPARSASGAVRTLAGWPRPPSSSPAPSAATPPGAGSGSARAATQFGTLVEEARADAGRRSRPGRCSGSSTSTPTEAERIGTGVPELDRVLGGGLVPASLVLVGGEPGRRQVDPAAQRPRAR